MFKKLSYKKQEKVIVCLFLFVPLLFLIVFTFLPALYMFRLSFVEWNGFSGVKKWVGLANYIEIFKNPDYFKPLLNSLYYFVGGLLQLVIAFYLAVLLNSKIKGKSIFKALYFFPFLLNGVAVSLIFIFFFRPDGTLDSILKVLGMGGFIQQWLGNSKIINFSLAGVSIWRYIGLNFIVFLGAIQSVSPEVIEAADLDGASEWQKVIYITLPSVRSIMELNFILTISGAISVFEIPYIMTSGANGSSTFVIQTVNTAFKFQQVGLGSAMAMVVLVIVGIATIIQNRFFKEAE